MGICPRCSKEINELLYSADVTEYGTFNGSNYYESSIEYTGSTSYSYPDCGEVITESEIEASRIINECPVTKW
jgi:hypothetical protein